MNGITNLEERTPAGQAREVEGCTYVFESRSSGLCRIGWAASEEWVITASGQDPDIRTVVVAYGNVMADLYRRYAQKKVGSEWFILTDRDITELRACYPMSLDDCSKGFLIHTMRLNEHDSRISRIEHRLVSMENRFANMNYAQQP